MLHRDDFMMPIFRLTAQEGHFAAFARAGFWRVRRIARLYLFWQRVDDAYCIGGYQFAEITLFRIILNSTRLH